MEDKNISVITRREFIRRAACAAVGTVAMTSSIRDLRLMNAAVAQSNITKYKALVCVFLQGGNDSNNLIIPTDPADYNSYSTIRTLALAIPSSAILSLNYTDSAGHSYGLHPACPELTTLFGQGKVAFMLNTGTLVTPINTRTNYLSSAYAKPPQLFSHADQQVQWQTSIPDQPPTTGWGGRCADLLNSVQPNAPISLCVSLAGSNTFEVGNIVSQYSVSSNGAISLSGLSSARLAALTNILGLDYANLQEQAYAGVGEHAIQTGQVLNNAIATNAGNYFTNPSFPTSITNSLSNTKFTSSLSPQLQMVARLIDAGNRSTALGGFGMKRQIFFVQIGGYDLHSGQTNYNTNNPNNVLVGAHSNLLAELSQSLYAFQRAMEQIGLSQQVTAFTASDFSRTFPCNGSGTDHGWGSHHFIVGGAVNGGQTYGALPALAVNGPNDTGTGRWIPTTAVDQYFATLATWFGVDNNSNLATIFPNLGRFSSGNLGFMQPA